MYINILEVLSGGFCIYSLIEVTQHNSHRRNFHSASQHTILELRLNWSEKGLLESYCFIMSKADLFGAPETVKNFNYSL